MKRSAIVLDDDDDEADSIAIAGEGGAGRTDSSTPQKQKTAQEAQGKSAQDARRLRLTDDAAIPSNEEKWSLPELARITSTLPVDVDLTADDEEVKHDQTSLAPPPPALEPASTLVMHNTDQFDHQLHSAASAISHTPSSTRFRGLLLSSRSPSSVGSHRQFAVPFGQPADRPQKAQSLSFSTPGSSIASMTPAKMWTLLNSISLPARTAPLPPPSLPPQSSAFQFHAATFSTSATPGQAKTPKTPRTKKVAASASGTQADLPSALAPPQPQQQTNTVAGEVVGALPTATTPVPIKRAATMAVSTSEAEKAARLARRATIRDAENTAALQAMVRRQEQPITPSSPLRILDSTSSHEEYEASQQFRRSTLLNSKTHWIIFSDLHVRTSTLDVCRRVLQFVHQKAVKHNAGVLFLGDFWDTVHSTGSLNVQLLEQVTQMMRSVWSPETPLVMIPGNHDQSNVDGLRHGLHALETVFPFVAVFSHPIILRGALWMPYRRNEEVLLEHLRAAVSNPQVSTIFCHADLKGAFMSGKTMPSMFGIDPKQLDLDRTQSYDATHSPVMLYSGHYHCPAFHPTNSQIMYIGSPYQVSASEAHQVKRLVHLKIEDAVSSGQAIRWVNQGDILIPEDIAPRNFQVFSTADLAPIQKLIEDGHIRAGDRIHGHLSEMEFAVANGEQLRREWTDKGLRVTIRVTRDATLASDSNVAQSVKHELSPRESLLQFLEQRSYYSKSVGLKAMAMLDQAISVQSETTELEHKEIDFEKVTFSGFGPFRSTTVLELSDRGLVVVVGSNQDDAEHARSNGAGKSMLLGVPFWVLFGTDTQGRTSQALLNKNTTKDAGEPESTKIAGSLEGTINRQKFTLTRTSSVASKFKDTMTLKIGDEAPKSATQELINQLFCNVAADTGRKAVGPAQMFLLNTVFHTAASSKQVDVFEQSAAERSSMLQSLFDLGVWVKAHDFAKSQLDHVKAECSVAQKSETTLTERLSTSKQFTQAFEHDNAAAQAKLSKAVNAQAQLETSLLQLPPLDAAKIAVLKQARNEMMACQRQCVLIDTRIAAIHETFDSLAAAVKAAKQAHDPTSSTMKPTLLFWNDDSHQSSLQSALEDLRRSKFRLDGDRPMVPSTGTSLSAVALESDAYERQFASLFPGSAKVKQQKQERARKQKGLSVSGVRCLLADLIECESDVIAEALGFALSADLSAVICDDKAVALRLVDELGRDGKGMSFICLSDNDSSSPCSSADKLLPDALKELTIPYKLHSRLEAADFLPEFAAARQLMARVLVFPNLDQMRRFVARGESDAVDLSSYTLVSVDGWKVTPSGVLVHGRSLLPVRVQALSHTEDAPTSEVTELDGAFVAQKRSEYNSWLAESERLELQIQRLSSVIQHFEALANEFARCSDLDNSDLPAISAATNWIPSFSGTVDAFEKQCAASRRKLRSHWEETVGELPAANAVASKSPEDFASLRQQMYNHVTAILSSTVTSETMQRELDRAKAEVLMLTKDAEERSRRLADHTHAVTKLAQDLEALTLNLSSLKASISEWEQVGGSDGILSKRKIVPFVFEAMIRRLQVFLDAYMAALAGRHVRAIFHITTNESRSALPDVVVRLSIGGTDFQQHKSLAQSALSSGQRQRFELALRLAKADLLSERHRVRFNVMFFDEIFNFLDDVGQKHILELLPRLLKPELAHRYVDHGGDVSMSLDQHAVLDGHTQISSIFVISHLSSMATPWEQECVRLQNGQASLSG
ncbi:hypothetical protein CAOG_07842 [Capsaspora owczarzaki ATCC 30864]|uniref:hypothetical protein n=1 Tax=Capsaspora owczarzaki (strain ATCC 30864) TaxID=595528 RepID=UPI0003520C21|nr:hypothetical protein CAOG_07842 [Capsaspora owczarzaki ATCC 30864]|eukprot:XP_004342915.2 hypothetical protein CAOG_07842 [Capsaspora owczarzaki ATCC 30864]